MSTLSKRIHISSPTKELETIQKALNSMLSKLEKVFNSERKFFSDAAHTLKTPLAVLRSQIENCKLSQRSKDELLVTIDTTSDTIQDLLFLSIIGNKSQNITSFSLTDLMTDLSELAATLGEDKNLTILTDIQENVSFKADKKLLQRALSNIVHNAVSYNNPNGTISIRLKKQPDHIVIIVEDKGVGIKKRDQAQVFTRFFRGSNAETRGSGLGLAISKAVIESFGGRISLKSSLNKGTTVTITF